MPLALRGENYLIMAEAGERLALPDTCPLKSQPVVIYKYFFSDL